MAKILQWINYNGTSYELDGVAYAVCSTSGTATTKIADSENTLNFKLINGAKVVVKFSNAITSGTSSLQIGTTTPKVMKYNGSLIGPGMISNDQVCEFVYDSTEDAWLLVGGTGTGSGDDGSTSLDFRGTIQSNTALPNSHSLGMVYRVGADGVYAGQNCEVGDLIICINEGSSANNSDWTIIQKNVDVALFKGSNAFSDGQLLLADGANGKVKAVDLNPTLTVTNGTVDDGPKIKIAVGGIESSERTINTATTAVYGVTKLSNTPNANEQNLAATPKLVNNAIAAGLANVSFNDAAVSGQYVSEVNQTNGEISVTRANFTPTINKTSAVDENPDYFTISVGGATSSPAVALSTATGAVYGVTKLISDASASNNLYAATPGMVQGAITAKINTLDVSDIAAETGKYISAVAEENGLISATKANFNPSINKTSSTSDDPDSFTISVGGATSSSMSLSQATSSVFGVVKLTNNAGTDQNLAATPYAVNAAINSALSSTTYSDTAVTGQYVSEVDQTNGTISVTRADFNPSVSITPTPLDNPDLTPSIAISVGGASSSGVNLPAATTAVYGVTKLSNATNSQDSTVAASSKAVADKIKRLYLYDYYDETTGNYIWHVSISPLEENVTPIGLTESEFQTILDNASLNNELIILSNNGEDYILENYYGYDNWHQAHFYRAGSIYYWSTSLANGRENNLVVMGQYERQIPTSTITGTLPVSKGGTGATSFTANSIIMSGDSTTSPLVTRPVTDNITNIAISNNNTNIPTMNTIYYGLATINGNSQHRGINIYAPTDATNAVLNDVAVYNSSTGAAEFKTLATMQVNTGYHFEENQTLDSNATSGITAKVTTTSNNLGVLELSWISLSSDGAATVATGGFTDNTATAAYADGNVRSW